MHIHCTIMGVYLCIHYVCAVQVECIRVKKEPNQKAKNTATAKSRSSDPPQLTVRVRARVRVRVIVRVTVTEGNTISHKQ